VVIAGEAEVALALAEVLSSGDGGEGSHAARGREQMRRRLYENHARG
jgi:hypothetical protein